ncbi:hypothetical protein IKQ19_09675, partial [Candidatus Saccharibacteria bacterium]|nr:hypothetical protein [Candidatus Saccharibacteria bacterium]
GVECAYLPEGLDNPIINKHKQLTPQKAACIQANCYLNNRPCSKTMRQAQAGRRRERLSGPL